MSEAKVQDISVVCPGQRLGHADEMLSGIGTVLRSNYVYSTLAGIKTVAQIDGEELPIVQVILPHVERGHSAPEIGSVVTAKVISVNPRFAKTAILCVGNTPLASTFSGMIRVQDIRATAKDQVEVYQSFRPGDIVRAEVISLGDSRSYYLSTAKNELGVVFAQSDAGVTMIPLSWCEMMCPKTRTVQSRKVAKV